MIIFDLDGTLADCEHRRHFVEDRREIAQLNELHLIGDKFKPDWKAFCEACDKDFPIHPVIEILDGIYQNTVNFWKDVQIWSGRCESVREKTIKWLEEHVLWDGLGSQITIKMRPIGDNIPDDQLKERWIDETLAQGKNIDFVFDSDPKSIAMWRRRGIFVFDVNQSGKEF